MGEPAKPISASSEPKPTADTMLAVETALAPTVAEPTFAGHRDHMASAWTGAWKQESIDGDGYEALLKAEKTPWLIRKLVKSIKRKLDIEVDGQGFVVIN